MADALRQTGNASSVHRHGRLARRLIEEARHQVAHLVGAAPADVVFTSGGTEANNWALLDAAESLGVDHIMVSAIEHHSVLTAVERASCQSTLIPVTPEGVVDLDRLEQTLQAANGQTVMVSVMSSNNETGILQPLEDVAALAKAHGACLHCDAVQSAGKTSLDVNALGLDFVSLSAHKLGGPQGVGALIIRSGLDIRARAVGGTQESRRRAGTENVPGIVGFGRAADLASDCDGEIASCRLLRDRLEDKVLAMASDAVIFGRDQDRLPNTSYIGVEGLKAETLVMALDLAGVSVSAGSACSSGKVSSSHVLTAMDAPDSLAASAVRVSLGWNSSQEDVDRFVTAWGHQYATQRKINPLMSASVLK